jgi:Rieske 2Fe-2S family protein
VALERTLPRDAYFADAVWRLEKERIFAREWVCAGREEQLPSAGDYLVLDVAGESVLVVRTRAGELRAYYNTCRHRGCRLVLDSSDAREDTTGAPAGRFASGIRCPYHSWTYSLEGTLRTAPFLEEEDGFRREDFPLWPVGLETWGGFFFLNLSPLEAAADGRSLLRQLGAVPDRLGRYPLVELRVARRLVYEVRANWKVLLENYNECYHCSGVHPELCKVVPAFRQKGGAGLDWDRGVPHREGAWTFTHSGTSARAPFPGLSDDEKVLHKGELVYPNFLLSLSADHVAAFVLRPHGPERTRVVCEFLFHPDEMGRPDFDPTDAVDFWDLVNRQDWAICEGVQDGMRSRVFTHGYYAPMESWSLDIRRYIQEHLGDLPPS